MKTTLLIACLLLVGGCVNEPGWPERDGAKALRAQGWNEATVERVVQGQRLKEDQYDRLENLDNNVRFLLARNPHLSTSRMQRLSKSSADFVRAGLARNPALPKDLVAVLEKDPSHTVWVGLAANPSLDVDTLLKLKAQKKLDWSWFAMNPACPEEIQARIRREQDEKGIYWLERTQKSLRGWPIEERR